ncbi:histidine phosphatase family protein [Gracilibacillus dipsosauri]|uniref:Histidine phosphatase family protein n=1 Tax=Gracilibacillus dipsosauri TaxID=178340 RepID=A0A317KYV4_9BACI|nr:histidine phosphatase family protein [Gracilibacillus dipsosauri]PWU68264.1 histidine phosphatase family protein [Gracilibacillus dipsosauri]
MTSVCLVRHGETDWNAQGKLQGKTDIPLNQNGIKQAEECRSYLQEFDWDLIISSPLKRAKSTAEIINQGLNIEHIVMAEFSERSFGDAEGMTFEERNNRYPDSKYPNIESRNALNKRVMVGIDHIIERYAGKKILLVAHGGVINTILSMFSEGEIGAGKTRLLNACISNIEYIQEKWQIHDYNQVNHLTPNNN